jgi:hypothetical protein
MTANGTMPSAVPLGPYIMDNDHWNYDILDNDQWNYDILNNGTMTSAAPLGLISWTMTNGTIILVKLRQTNEVAIVVYVPVNRVRICL